MAGQVTNGKAFEWATAVALSDILGVEIDEGPAADTARRCFDEISLSTKKRFIAAATLGSEHIIRRESNNPTVLDPERISLATDSAGQRGDVRDILISSMTGDSFGISCKSNHEAFKHSRASMTIDFVKKWGLDDRGSSAEYWSTIRPVFETLSDLRSESNGQALFKSQPHYQERFYEPVLEAFEKEILRVTSIDNPNSTAAIRALVDYIIGRQDFYKLIVKARTKEVVVQEFNFGGSLEGQSTPYPALVIGIDKIDGSKPSRNVRFQKGLTLNFRIHNGESKIIPSLKWDVTAISLSPEIYQHHQSL